MDKQQPTTQSTHNAYWKQLIDDLQYINTGQLYSVLSFISLQISMDMKNAEILCLLSDANSTDDEKSLEEWYLQKIIPLPAGPSCETPIKYSKFFQVEKYSIF